MPLAVATSEEAADRKDDILFGAPVRFLCGHVYWRIDHKRVTSPQLPHPLPDVFGLADDELEVVHLTVEQELAKAVVRLDIQPPEKAVLRSLPVTVIWKLTQDHVAASAVEGRQHVHH